MSSISGSKIKIKNVVSPTCSTGSTEEKTTWRDVATLSTMFAATATFTLLTTLSWVA